ncbi:hypothetical protein [Thermosyntropha sp.]|uniref:hypothetical protein n=1 Tax=Thermosyntropha sp. TaxID=2740820 RepID=UPI0025D76F77|nr:hypothetical protein [Thermosyntropha sp.]MBO8158290.1 hypothetical protein [Thermosyntropha sp.]
MPQINIKDKNFKNFTKLDFNIAERINIDLAESDVIDNLGNLQNLTSVRKLFLGKFSEEDLYNMIESIGMLDHLKSMGFSDIHLVIDKDENYINYLKLYWKDESPENQLLDLRVSEHMFMPNKVFFEEEDEVQPYDMILIEWLSARNPLGVFDEKRPQLPGQSSPGLGILKYCFKILYNVSSEIFKDGYFDIPNHIHGAIMYSKKFKFFDPVQEAMLRAIMRDLEKYSLSDISWGIITKTIIDLDENIPAVYEPSEQVHYISDRMRKYFESKKYVTTFKKYYQKILPKEKISP